MPEMTHLLPDLSDPGLVPALQRNLYDYIWSLRDHWHQGVFEQSEKQRRWYTPLPYAFVFNAAISTCPPDGDETPLIQDTIAFFRTRGRQEFNWWLEPGLETSGWGPQLEAQGLTFLAEPPGMAVDLSRLPGTVPAPAGMQIRRVEDAAGMQVWTQTFVEGYGLPPDWVAPLGEMMRATLQPPVRCHSYLAVLEGQPVAASSVFYHAGVAGIYSVATLKAWRGKGIGAAVTLYPLLAARSAGYHVGILQASDMGYPVYQRLGFQEVCRMNHYYWQQVAS